MTCMPMAGLIMLYSSSRLRKALLRHCPTLLDEGEINIMNVPDNVDLLDYGIVDSIHLPSMPNIKLRGSAHYKTLHSAVCTER